MKANTAPREIPVPRWFSLSARDIMQTRIITVSDTAPLSDVERVLSENRISGVPVTDQTGRVIGVVSVRDLLDRYVEDPDARPKRGPGYFRESSDDLADEDFESFELPPEGEETAASVMTAEVFTVPSDAPLAEVARQLVSHKIHRVLVTNRSDGRVAGIVTSMGVLAALSA